MNYSRNKNYFQRKRIDIAIIIMVLAVVFAAFFYSIADLGSMVMSMLVSVLSGAYVYYAYSVTPKDEEIDRVVRKAVQERLGEEEILTNKLGALTNKLSAFDETSKPMIVSSFYFNDFDHQTHLTRTGKDGHIKSSNVSASSFLFLDDQFVFKRFIFSIIAPSEKEMSEEFYYDDIVTVKTETVTQAIPHPKKHDVYTKNQLLKFILITKGGNNLTLSFKNDEKIQALVNKMKYRIRVRKVDEKGQDEVITDY